MNSGLKEYTLSGNVKLASLVEVAQRVKNICNSNTIETVKSGLLEYHDHDSESEKNEELDDSKVNELSQTNVAIF